MKYRLLGACAAAFCCAVPVFAQGLSRVELLGLQQQLRDDGCGVTHVTGRMDAMTRSAIKKCESKYSGATDARSMLDAMHIGFGSGNPTPTVSMARSGAAGSLGAGGSSELMSDTTAGRMRHGTKSMMKGMTKGMKGMMTKDRMKDTTGGRMMRRDRMRDSTMHPRDTSGTMGSGGMVDMKKATPMAPATTNPMSPSTPTPSMNPRNSSTMRMDTSTIKHDTTAKRDTMPKPN